MNIQLLAGKLARTLREHGVQEACRRALGHLGRRSAADPFDSRHGTDTGGLEPLWKLSIRSPNARFGERYEATGEQELTAALAHLGADYRRFTFIDLGCGKGRPLLVAARSGFARVVGVEFARELAEIARRNLQRQGATQATVVHGDAAEFAFPAGNLVVYLYNPFSDQVLRKVVAHLQADASGDCFVIYKSPRCAAVWDAAGTFSRMPSPPLAPHLAIWRRSGRAADSGATA